MKKLFVLCVVFLAAIFIGCQENLITDPVEDGSAISSENNFVLDKDFISYLPKSIRIEGYLPDPSHRLNGSVEIKGLLRYRQDGGSRTPNYTTSHPPVTITMDLNARLFGGCNYTKWSAAGRSTDVVAFTSTNATFTYLEKTFRVKGNCCGILDLVLKFKVTEKTFELDSMWLKKVPGPVVVGDPVW